MDPPCVVVVVGGGVVFLIGKYIVMVTLTWSSLEVSGRSFWSDKNTCSIVNIIQLVIIFSFNYKVLFFLYLMYT